MLARDTVPGLAIEWISNEVSSLSKVMVSPFGKLPQITMLPEKQLPVHLPTTLPAFDAVIVPIEFVEIAPSSGPLRVKLNCLMTVAGKIEILWSSSTVATTLSPCEARNELEPFNPSRFNLQYIFDNPPDVETKVVALDTFPVKSSVCVAASAHVLGAIDAKAMLAKQIALLSTSIEFSPKESVGGIYSRCDLYALAAGVRLIFE